MFVCYGGGHAKMVIPTVHAIRTHAGWSAVVLAATTAGPEMRAAGIAAYGYQHLIRHDDARARAFGRTLLGDSHNPALGIPVEESIAYLGLCFADLAERIGESAAWERYREHGRHAFLPLDPLRRALDKWRPDVVITTNSPKSERAALVVAEERGTPSVRIEDLLGLPLRLHPSFVPFAWGTLTCVASAISAENLEKLQNVPREKIRLTGNPAFDRLALVPAALRELTRSRLGLRATDRLVLFTAGAAIRAERLAVIAAEVLASGDGVHFIVRRHPNDRRLRAGDYLRGLPERVVLGDDEFLDGLLVACDVLMTVSSTTAVEAVLVGRPVVQLGPGTGIADEAAVTASDLPLYRYGLSVLVDDPASVRSIVSAALETTERERLRDMAARLFVPPGGAAAAVADLAARLAL